MTRAVVNDAGTIRLAELDDVPGGGALEPVLVELVAADIQPKDRQTARGEMRLPLPPFFVCGSQAVGRLEDGSLVFVRGSIDAAGGLRDGVYAERFVAESYWLLPLPAGLDPVVAAAGTACLADALYALDDVGRLAAGDTVLVLGASSGVGAAAVSIALARGHRVVAATRDVSSVAARDGLTVVTYDDLVASVRGVTDGRGADVCIDNVGGPLTALGLRAGARRGRHLLVGYLAGRALELTTMDLIPAEVALIGVNSGSVPRERQRELTAEALSLLASRAHVPPSVRPLPLAEGVEALLVDAPGRTVLLGAAYSCLDATV
jgi:NADPH2:quinone reductase